MGDFHATSPFAVITDCNRCRRVCVCVCVHCPLRQVPTAVRGGACAHGVLRACMRRPLGAAARPCSLLTPQPSRRCPPPSRGRARSCARACGRARISASACAPRAGVCELGGGPAHVPSHHWTSVLPAHMPSHHWTSVLTAVHGGAPLCVALGGCAWHVAAVHAAGAEGRDRGTCTASRAAGRAGMLAAALMLVWVCVFGCGCGCVWVGVGSPDFNGVDGILGFGIPKTGRCSPARAPALVQLVGDTRASRSKTRDSVNVSFHDPARTEASVVRCAAGCAPLFRSGCSAAPKRAW